MSEPERLIKFQLLGQDFAFYTGASEEEMDAILRLVKQQVEDSNGGTSGTIPVSKIAVMACLNLASRYVRLRKDFDEYRQDTQTQFQVLNERLEDHFSQE